MRDITDWTYRYFQDVKETSTDLIVNCPFCPSPDTKYHLHISKVMPACHCFRCDYSGSWNKLVKDCGGQLTDSDSITPLYQLIKHPSISAKKVLEPLEDMPDDFITLGDALGKGIYERTAEAAYQYIVVRLGTYVQHIYSSKLMDVWGIWASSRGFGKIVFPVERGWWQERIIEDLAEFPKYISATAPKEDRLYNYQALDNYDEVCIAEGIISAAAIGCNAVALCGKKATSAQLSRLYNSAVSRFVICLDSEAYVEAVELAYSLNRGTKEVAIRRYREGDPASCKVYRDEKYTGMSTRIYTMLTQGAF